MRSRRSLPVLVAILASAGFAGLGTTAASAAAPSARFDVAVPGGWFAWGSPVIGDVNNDGVNETVVGGLDGYLYAYDANGTQMWRSQRATAALASTPAIGDVDGDGRNEIVVGTGALDGGAYNGPTGALDIYNGDGSLRCQKPMSTAHGTTNPISAAPSIGDVTGDGINDIVFGAHDTTIYVLDGHCTTLSVFDNRDSVFSTAALYDVDHSGQSDIFIGGDATANAAVPGDSFNGGVFRRLHYNGTSTLTQIWRHDSTETFQSGAAIGDITGDGVPEVVTGAGAFWCRTKRVCSDSNKVWAFNLGNGANVPGWPKTATMNTTFSSAPALGDLDGDGVADVVIGSNNYDGDGALAGGAIDAYYSRGGHKVFDHSVQDMQQPGSVVIADVDGTPGNEVVFADTGRVGVLNGSLADTGLNLGGVQIAHVNAPAIGQLGTGRWAVVSAGFDPNPGHGNAGHLVAWSISTPTSAPWPMVGKNALHIGTDPAVVTPISCNAGYRLVAADGGVFAFGNAGFFGSAGGIRLNQPIVGGVPTKSGSGYWFVARDGGIFNYGDAKFFGSTGAIRLNQPIVGMAASPTGNGYWLVAADGGIFNYGDAKFFGSTGAIRLNQPIVGMSSSPSGKGYWFVASDGGIFNYGDTKFYGSTGGITLAQPVVGMRVTPSGNGYWFVARDGGIFNYGDAEFCGSTGRKKLNSPIVAMS